MRQTGQLSDVTERLIELLKLEKMQLMQGDYRSLEGVAEEKASCCKALDAHLEDPASQAAVQPLLNRIQSIKMLADHNAALLSAAKSGVTSAKTRLHNIFSQENTVGTYTASGAKLRSHDALGTKHKLA